MKRMKSTEISTDTIRTFFFVENAHYSLWKVINYKQIFIDTVRISRLGVEFSNLMPQVITIAAYDLNFVTLHLS